MNEIKLNVGKAVKLNNPFNHEIKIGCSQKGYYIYINGQKSGPFYNIFLEKSLDGDKVLIGYTPSKSVFFRINEKGITSAEKADVEIYDLQSNATVVNSLIADANKEKLKDTCTLLGGVDTYSIYLDSNNMFFAVDNLEPLKPLDQYPKYDEYDDLLEHHKKLGVSLYSKKIDDLANKIKRKFINFIDLHYYINNLKVEDLQDSLLIDIAADRDSFKDIFLQAKKVCSKIAKKEEDIAIFSNLGYVEYSYKGIDKLKILFPNEYESLRNLTKAKVEELKAKCISKLKEKDAIDFEKLYDCFNNIHISELEDKIKRELGSTRPLTPGIFAGLLSIAIDNYNQIGTPIREEYKTVKNFKVIYPKEYDELWHLLEKKRVKLYEEHLEQLYLKSKR